MMKYIGVYLLVFMMGFVAIDTPKAAGNDLENDTRYSFEFVGEPLAAVLETIVSAANVDLIFDPILVDGHFIYQRIRNKTLNETLRQVLTETGLDFIILSTGTYVVVASSVGKPSYGSFSGIIADAFTGEPLPGATIMLADASGGTTTNLTGQFNFPPLISGNHEIVFSYVGYKPVRKTIRVESNASNVQHVLLQPAKIDFSPVVVTAHKPFFAGNHRAEQNISELSQWETGGRMPDAIRSLNMHTGVQNGISFTDVHIQGAQKGNHRIFLDDAPVYNPASFGQMYSAFSPYAIGRIQVDKAGFSAPSGSFISGKINMNHELDFQNPAHALFQVNSLAANIRGAASMQPTAENKLKIMSAYRSTFQDVYTDPVLSNTLNRWDIVDPMVYNILTGQPGTSRSFDTQRNASEVNFYDFHTAARYDIGDYHSIKFSLYAGQNQVYTDILAQDPVAQDFVFARDRYKWQNLVTQLSYNWLASPRLDIRFQGSYSRNTMNHQYAMLFDDDVRAISDQTESGALFSDVRQATNAGRSQFDSNEINHIILKTEASYIISPKLNVQSGFQFDAVESAFNLTDFFYLPTLSEQKSNIFSTFLNASWMAAPNVQIEAGSRLSALNNGKNLYAEPRLSIQYDRPESEIGYYSVKLSGGIYHQFVNQFEITNVGPSSLVPDFVIWAHDSTIRQPKAYHTSLSILIEPNPETGIFLETYARIQPAAYITSHRNLMVGNEVNREGFDAFAEISEMASYGAGLRVNRSYANNRIQLMGGYDFSISRIDMESQFGGWLSAPWNEPHRFQFRALGRLTPNLSVVTAWQGIYGRSWAFRQAYYDFMVPHNFTNESGFDFTDPENDQLKPFEQWDVSFIYAPSYRSINIEFRLDLINILNRSNTVDWNLYYPNGSEEPQIRERNLPGFSPSLSIRFTY